MSEHCEMRVLSVYYYFKLHWAIFITDCNRDIIDCLCTQLYKKIILLFDLFCCNVKNNNEENIEEFFNFVIKNYSIIVASHQQ